MNEMQLFEVGLAEKFSGSYFAKRYVIAADDLEARGKMRRYTLMEAEETYPDHSEEDEITLEEHQENRAEYMDVIANLLVTRIVHVGQAIV